MYSLSLIFSTLCVVHDLIFQRKLSRRRLPIAFVHFVSHASAQALRPITFTQRFRTTRHLFSIQLLWKPKILNVEDKRTKFEQSKGDLGQFPESCKWSLTPAQLSKHIDLRCFLCFLHDSRDCNFSVECQRTATLCALQISFPLFFFSSFWRICRVQ